MSIFCRSVRISALCVCTPAPVWWAKHSLWPPPAPNPAPLRCARECGRTAATGALGLPRPCRAGKRLALSGGLPPLSPVSCAFDVSSSESREQLNLGREAVFRHVAKEQVAGYLPSPEQYPPLAKQPAACIPCLWQCSGQVLSNAVDFTSYWHFSQCLFVCLFIYFHECLFLNVIADESKNKGKKIQ